MTAYRASTPTCPTCHEALEAHTIATDAIVDVCPKCGGVWIDWDDGDLTALAREVPPIATRALPRSGPGACPRCNRPLAIEVFQQAAEVLRCGECGGAFLPYASIGKIAASTPADAREDAREHARDSDAPDGGTPAGEGAWSRLVARVRQWMRGS